MSGIADSDTRDCNVLRTDWSDRLDVYGSVRLDGTEVNSSHRGSPALDACGEGDRRGYDCALRYEKSRQKDSFNMGHMAISDRYPSGKTSRLYGDQLGIHAAVGSRLKS